MVAPFKHVQIYRGKGFTSRWRYRVVAANGEIVDASQAYYSKWNAKRAARNNHPDLPIQY